MNTPTKQQLDRLPKYAQQYIRSLERANDCLRKKLKRDRDAQTPSKISYEEFVNTGESHETERRYVQAERIVVINDGVHLTVNCYRSGIELQWGVPTKHGSPTLGDISFIPSSYQAAKLINPIYNPTELQRLKESRERLENDGN